MPTPRNLRSLDLGAVPARRFFAATNVLAASTDSHEPCILLTGIPLDRLCTIGAYQDAEREIDAEQAASQGIPVYRRTIGGGTLCVDEGMLCFSLVMNRSGAGYSISRMCQSVLPAVVATYRELGVDAHFVPPREVRYHNSLLSTADVGRVGNSLVLTTTIVCSRHTPDVERYAPSVPLSSIEIVLGNAPQPTEVREVLLKHLQKAWRTEFAAGALTTEEQEATTSEALKLDGSALVVGTTVAEMKNKAEGNPDLTFRSSRHVTASGNTIFVNLLLKGDEIEDVRFTGDFIFSNNDYPELRRVFRMVPVEWDRLMTAIENFYLTSNVDSPGVLATDWVTAIDTAINTA